MTAIIILNWNGPEDTIECLRSLEKLDTNDFFIVLIDNGSSEDNLQKIKNFLKYDWKFNHTIIKYNIDVFPSFISNKECILYEMDKNYGFAKGNNIGIEFAKTYNPNFGLLLNNDTIVTPNLITYLCNFANKHPEMIYVTPKIFYFKEKDKIWNCGGKIVFGFRKYFYQNKKREDLPPKEYIKISFITGCCLFFRFKELTTKIFTEDFFFGEEDFELSLRCKQNNQKMACLFNTEIYHKVGSSINKSYHINKLYIHQLNRFINLKNFLSPFKFNLWKILNSINLYLRILKGLSHKEKITFIKDLYKKGGSLNCVTKETFESIINNKK